MKWIKKFRLNIKPILCWTLNGTSAMFSVLTIVLTIVSWEDMKITDVLPKVFILLGIPILVFIISSFVIITSLKKKCLWANGRNKVLAFFGDLFRVVKRDEKKIIVIPVNDTFETIVDDDLSTPNPLVASTTLHGKWIKYMEKFGYNSDKLYTIIRTNLIDRGYSPIFTDSQRKRGKQESYKLGTIATVNVGDTTFYLLAIACFNKDNVAKSSRKLIRDCIDELLDFYDQNGQGYPIYIPLFGTGRSRADLTYQQAFNILKSSILTNEKTIHGVVNLVIYKNDKDKVSIYK